MNDFIRAQIGINIILLNMAYVKRIERNGFNYIAYVIDGKKTECYEITHDAFQAWRKRNNIEIDL